MVCIVDMRWELPKFPVYCMQKHFSALPSVSFSICVQTGVHDVLRNHLATNLYAYTFLSCEMLVFSFFSFFFFLILVYPKSGTHWVSKLLVLHPRTWEISPSLPLEWKITRKWCDKKMVLRHKLSFSNQKFHLQFCMRRNQLLNEFGLNSYPRKRTSMWKWNTCRSTQTLLKSARFSNLTRRPSQWKLEYSDTSVTVTNPTINQ